MKRLFERYWNAQRAALDTLRDAALAAVARWDPLTTLKGATNTGVVAPSSLNTSAAPPPAFVLSSSADSVAPPKASARMSGSVFSLAAACCVDEGMPCALSSVCARVMPLRGEMVALCQKKVRNARVIFIFCFPTPNQICSPQKRPARASATSGARLYLVKKVCRLPRQTPTCTLRTLRCSPTGTRTHTHTAHTLSLGSGADFSLEPHRMTN